jgi:hypothetical protein
MSFEDKLELMSEHPRPVTTFIQNREEGCEAMTATRFVGLDVHKRQVTVAAVNAQQEVVLSLHKVSVAGFTAWAKAHLQASDQVALEATSNAWEFHEQVAAVSVANSQQIKLISASARKTDKRMHWY